ncbi:hypothetical protein ACM66B_001785 [Microbotryomycetes sp. NB124-2]
MTVTPATRQVAFTSRTKAPDSPLTTYSLLALPASIATALASSSLDSPLEIRGSPTDAAVLVTNTDTYAIRGVQNSNSLCLSSTSAGGDHDWFDATTSSPADSGSTKLDKNGNNVIEIETVLHETLELVKTVPKLDKLDELLKGTEYIGQDAELVHKTNNKKVKVTFDRLRSNLPASDNQIKSALTNKRVVEVGNELRRVPNSFMLLLLSSLLKALPDSALAQLQPEEDEGESGRSNADSCKTPVKQVVNKKGKGKGKATATTTSAQEQIRTIVAVADKDELELALDAVDCSEHVAKQVISWYEDESVEHVGQRQVAIRVHELVRDLGLSTLETEGYIAQRLDAFMTRWKDGSKPFDSMCTLQLLAGHHVVNTSHPPTITYLPPCRLSSDPATRFSELFSIKPKWKDTDMILFLNDLVNPGDTKKRDALVLKFVRKVKDPKDGSTLWTARNLW